MFDRQDCLTFRRYRLRAYAARRRTSGGGTPRRVLADFVIGTHAASRAAQLVTLDAQHYAACFPDLKVPVPA